MATEFSNRGPTSVPSWRQKDSFTNPIIGNNEGSKLDDIREQRKRISYEKEYFMRMLKNIENESPIVKSSIESNNQDTTYKRYVLRNDARDQYNGSIQKEKSKERKHFPSQGLILQTSDGMLGVVDKIIEKNKDAINASPLSISTTTKDAGDMINFLLNRTYPNSFQGRGNHKSMIPTRSEVPLNVQKQRDHLNHRHSWSTMKNNTNKDKLSR